MKKIYTIGRDTQSDIVINDHSDVVSRLHATIRIEGSKMYLVDQSLNGTYVNGMRMTSNEEIPVTRKDTVSFANVVDLDWSLLPNPVKDRMKFVFMAIVAVAAVVCIIFAVRYFSDPKEPDVVINQYTDSTNTEVDAKPAEINLTDSIKAVEDDGQANNDHKKKNGKKGQTESTQDKSQKEETVEPEPEIPLY